MERKRSEARRIRRRCIKEICEGDFDVEPVKEFLYCQIKREYGIGPTPEFHYDIEGIKEYYILPKRNSFFVAYDEDKIVATAGIAINIIIARIAITIISSTRVKPLLLDFFISLFLLKIYYIYTHSPFSKK